MANPPSRDPKKNDKEEKKSIKDKLTDSYDSFKKNEKIEEIYNYATNNTRDTIAYILLIAGLILMLFSPPWYGATLVGVIFGLYFGDVIYKYISNYEDVVDRLGLVKSLILGGTLLGFFIASPFIFIGTAVAIAIRQFFGAAGK